MLDRFGTKYLHIALVIPYLDSDATVTLLMRLNKESNRRLKPRLL